MFVKEQWITREMENPHWLPSDYQVNSAVVRGSIVWPCVNLRTPLLSFAHPSLTPAYLNNGILLTPLIGGEFTWEWYKLK